jgi:tetratricopeptide (TPR) repeat protein
MGELDRAHSLVLNSGMHKFDPWLTAAEIALATASKTYSRSASTGLQMIASGKHSDFDLTELATALGTLEFLNGQNHKAKKLIRRALEDPNDNSLAQAKWVSRSMSGFPIDIAVAKFSVPRSFEANAFESYARGSWLESLEFALDWWKDQPFSSRPAHMASYLAGAILEDYGLSEKIARLGLIASPQDAAFVNNIAFCLASLGKIEEAKSELEKIKQFQLGGIQQVAYRANHGLIAFRRGNAGEGRDWYRSAVDQAREIANERFTISALLYWAREEALISSKSAREVLARARNAAKGNSDPDYPFLFARVENLMTKTDISPRAPEDH